MLGLSPLVLVNGNIFSVKYCEILEEGLLNSVIMTTDIPFLLQQLHRHVNGQYAAVHCPGCREERETDRPQSQHIV